MAGGVAGDAAPPLSWPAIPAPAKALRAAVVAVVVGSALLLSALTIADVDAYRVAVSAVDEPGFAVFLEPEGMTYQVVPGRGITLTFPPSAEPAQVSWTAAGLVVWRPLDAPAPAVTADDGTPLTW